MTEGERSVSAGSPIQAKDTGVKESRTRRRVVVSKERSKSSDSIISNQGMRDWQRAIRKPINYTVSNDVVRLQTTFVTVVMVLGTFVLLIFYLLLPSKVTATYPSVHEDHLHEKQQQEPCNGNPEYNATYPLSRPQIRAGKHSGIRYRIGLIADLDLDSKSQPLPANSSSSSSSSYWHSFLLTGYLTYEAEDEAVHIVWDEAGRRQLKSPLSSSGRGMELSELTVFNGKLYSCDDRTGIIYQIPIQDDKDTPLPWIILNDGSGESAKGFKCEWMTVKDQMLYVGGFGKEWTSTTGELINFDPQWIKVISVNGVIRHVDWRQQFLSLIKAAGIVYPGYMIHESAVWSVHHQKWFFLPRRASRSAYNEIEDERKGTNMLITADESFSEISVKTVGPVVPTLGYSSFKFIPGSKDHLIVALKSQEDAGSVATFITVFTADGKVILPDQRVASQNVKYEGIEFI